MKLYLAFAAMVLSALFEGFWRCYRGEPPFTQHQALINGIMNAIFVLSYYWGFWVVIQEKEKQMKIEITKENYSLALVRKNKDTTAYVFTENLYSITAFPNRYGGGSAVIRPEPNAFAIVTKKKYDYNTRENVDYTDTEEEYIEFVEVNAILIDNIKACGKDIIVFPKGFATDKAKMPTRFAEWLKEALMTSFGLITELNDKKTGLICQKVI